MNRVELLAAMLVLLAATAFGQMRGSTSGRMSSNTPSTGMGQSSMAGMQGSQSGMGSMG